MGAWKIGFNKGTAFRTGIDHVFDVTIREGGEITEEIGPPIAAAKLRENQFGIGHSVLGGGAGGLIGFKFENGRARKVQISEGGVFVRGCIAGDLRSI